jgi:hypothetical protein
MDYLDNRFDVDVCRPDSSGTMNGRIAAKPGCPYPMVIRANIVGARWSSLR